MLKSHLTFGNLQPISNMIEEDTHGAPALTTRLATNTMRPGPTNVENGSTKSNVTATLALDQALDTQVAKLQRPTNFGIVPLPKRLVYDPERPAHFGLLLNVVFGLSSTFSMSVETHTTTAKAIDDIEIQLLPICIIVNHC